ncbi:type II toxin-antitoxin system RelE/ParE family toxin [Nocardioides sp. NPDC051685]|uniref:type II toxin-antitoxin system RelE/ParE family toxin n=1 Tax=Nocardioides sp. NPDC051685 TaxID=3364334 RepID=UPI00379868F6
MVTDTFSEWFDLLDERSRQQLIDAIDRLAEVGPALGRPLVDRLQSSDIHNLKELRPGSTGRTEIRVIFVFDPWRSAIRWSVGTNPATGLAGTGPPSRSLKSSSRRT